MKPRYFIGIILMVALVGIVSADTISQGAGLTMDGTCNGIRAPLLPCTTAYNQYVWVYTWISIGFLGLIAGTASQKNAAFWAFLLPVFAAMFVWFGWMQLSAVNGVDQMPRLIGIIIMSGMLALAIYMKGRQQENFGIAGPGNPILNIVFWMFMIQASIACINAIGMFGDVGNASSTLNGIQNGISGDLQSNIPAISETGGFLSGLTSDLYLAGAGVIAAFLFLIKIVVSIVWFQSLVLSIAPFLAGNTIVGYFLTAMSVALDFAYAILFINLIFKLPMGESI
jgi:hypothetical protein